MVFAMEMTRRLEFLLHGHSNRLYIKVCFVVIKASSSSTRRTLTISAALYASIVRFDLPFWYLRNISFFLELLKKSSRNRAAVWGGSLWPRIFSARIV